MEEKKSNKISLSTILLIIAIILVVIMAIYLYVTKINPSKKVSDLGTNAINAQNDIDNLQEKTNNPIDFNKATVISSNTQSVSSEIEETQNQAIERLFLTYIGQLVDEYKETITKCRVDKITILTDEEKNETINSDPSKYKSDDVLAYVAYSVVPKDVNNSSWIAGNGHIDNDWIVDKQACVILRNGDLLIVGTSW